VARARVDRPVLIPTYTANPPVVNPGESYALSLFIQNSGSLEGKNLTFDYGVPQDTVILSSSFPFTVEATDKVRFSLGPLSAGQQRSLLLTLNTSALSRNEMILPNEGTLNFTDTKDRIYASQKISAPVTVADITPRVDLLVTFDTMAPRQERPFSTVIHYANSGNGTATNLNASYQVPTNATYLNATPRPDANLAGLLRWNLDLLPKGGTGEINIQLAPKKTTRSLSYLNTSTTFVYNDTRGLDFTPVSQAITIQLGDGIAPELNHTPLERARAGDNVTFILDARDDVALSRVILYVRPPGASLFSPVTLTPSGNRFTAKVNVGSEGGIFQYYFVANDTWGNRANLPAGWASRPFAITVQAPPTVINTTNLIAVVMIGIILFLLLVTFALRRKDKREEAVAADEEAYWREREEGSEAAVEEETEKPPEEEE